MEVERRNAEAVVITTHLVGRSNEIACVFDVDGWLIRPEDRDAERAEPYGIIDDGG